MPSGAGAEVEGIRDFTRAVRRASRDVATEMRRELKSEIAEPVARTVRGNVPEVSGNWRRNIRAGATSRGAHVVWGRRQVPYAGWMEFGGRRRGGPGGTAVAVRSRTPDGRYVYPEVGRARPEAEETVQHVLHRSFRRAELAIQEA